ncbi:type II toxin-antitoxin system RelE/ParE family toxin [Terriglobus sp.]|uniref:type II toxin-antitoxin system RelE/ParE family toxin n=1 Tax=Terriglobus sp. TaxID=1889013 RepID=UPI003B00BB87
MYEVEFTDEFRDWYEALSAPEQKSCVHVIELLMQRGPELGRPHADTLKGARFTNLKELRVQHAGNAYRIFFAFDRRRVALLLLGGIKVDGRFYKDLLPRAEELFANHLLALLEEDTRGS